MRRQWMLTIMAAILLACGLVAAAQEPVRTLGRVNSKLEPAQQGTPASSPAPSTAPVGSIPPLPPPSEAPGPATPAPEDNLLMEGESLYRHQAERDPFTPLVRTGALGPEVKMRPGSTGLARFTVESCIFEALIKTPQGTVAWFQGPDNKPYKAAVGERFADGVVLDVSYGSGEVTVQQELNDPTAIKPFRNLVLKIRSLEGEGQ